MNGEPELGRSLIPRGRREDPTPHQSCLKGCPSWNPGAEGGWCLIIEKQLQPNGIVLVTTQVRERFGQTFRCPGVKPVVSPD